MRVWYGKEVVVRDVWDIQVWDVELVVMIVGEDGKVVYENWGE